MILFWMMASAVIIHFVRWIISENGTMRIWCDIDGILCPVKLNQSCSNPRNLSIQDCAFFSLFHFDWAA